MKMFRRDLQPSQHSRLLRQEDETSDESLQHMTGHGSDGTGGGAWLKARVAILRRLDRAFHTEVRTHMSPEEQTHHEMRKASITMVRTLRSAPAGTSMSSISAAGGAAKRSG